MNEKNIALGEKSKFQIVLVGYDRDEAGHKSYVKKSKLNFPAVKMAEKEGLASLTSKGDTGFLPNLVLMKPDGTVVSNDRAEVLAKLKEMAGE